MGEPGAVHASGGAARAVAMIEAGYAPSGTDSDWLTAILDEAKSDMEHTGGTRLLREDDAPQRSKNSGQ